MWSWRSLLIYIGLVLILVGGLRGGAEHSGGLAVIGLLILGVITYPPPDARREARAVLVLGGVAGLLALWSLDGQFQAGREAAQAMDDLLVLGGGAMVLVHAAAQLLGDPVVVSRPGWGASATNRPRPVPPVASADPEAAAQEGRLVP